MKFSSENSKINFIVPDRRVLQSEQKLLEGKRPGIVTKMTDIIAKGDSEQHATYKMAK